MCTILFFSCKIKSYKAQNERKDTFQKTRILIGFYLVNFIAIFPVPTIITIIYISECLIFIKVSWIEILAKQGFLSGQLLLAMPGMTDTRFESAVIYICTHTEEGAMGLVINKLCDNIDFPDLLNQLNIDYSDETNTSFHLDSITLHEGGPVESGRGFILHSADYVQETTLIISETIAMTATIDILTAIAGNEGPQDYLIALGFSGWGRGQLENEILRNSWLTIEADEELVFRTDLDLKLPRALAKLGVDIRMLSSQFGNA